MAHIAILAALFIRDATAKPDALPLVPLDVTVCFESRSEDVSEPLSDNLSSMPSAPKQPTRQQIIPSTNRVIRNVVPLVISTPPAEQIAAELLASLASSSFTPPPTEVQGQNHDAEILREAFHTSWNPPPRHLVGGAKVIARVIFDPDGTVRSARVELPSGIPRFDSSVHEALQQITTITGLSEGTRQNVEGVTFEFSVAK